MSTPNGRCLIASLPLLLTIAALAEEMGDAAYAEQCRAILARGQKGLVAEWFDGDYFINKVDPERLDAINSGTGCEIDQVMGQSWAFQVGLPRVLPETETKAALQSPWKYNFTPDVGPYRAVNKPGRRYAMAGEAGLLMCTFPRSDWSFEQAVGKAIRGPAGYFNECMNGFDLDGQELPAKLVKTGSRAEIQLEGEAVLNADQSLNVLIT